ncbi:hypothetical protein [Aquabacterium parvum]|uniref:hypothetical protein n=1 Tax=Aquabacterium parvum TaxID=70584 RepID=UPI000718C2A1|nr:hypothetical protein [Aquabacterium parvum]MBU0916991.1 hypothetical protein [Gammaproteobacteria bacterium]
MPLAPGSAPAPAVDAPTRHWVIPFAASLSEPCQHALTRLKDATALPRLSELLGRLQPVARLEGDEYALAMPHERLLARELGWPEPDGLQPWAAWWARQDGLTLPADRCWALLSPGHWLMGRDHLTLLDPAGLGLSDDESRALLEALRPFFEEDGWTLQWGAATRWYASHAELGGLSTASLERVIGRNPDLWLAEDPDGHPLARKLRRLQAEAQMLLYNHPLNERRSEAGLATVNSFWVSGCGHPPADPGALTLPTHLRVVDELRAPLLADDMPLWLQAWRHIDAEVLPAVLSALDAGQAVQLTLCGERHALTFGPGAKPGLVSRWASGLKRLVGHAPQASPAACLAEL